MRQDLNKLVRDRIPDLIRATGKRCDTEILSPADYRQALRDKLREEAAEAAEASVEDLVIELADLSEVMAALMAAHGISPETVRQCQMERREERGAFRQRILLRSVQTPAPQAE